MKDLEYAKKIEKTFGHLSYSYSILYCDNNNKGNNKSIDQMRKS